MEYEYPVTAEQIVTLGVPALGFIAALIMTWLKLPIEKLDPKPKWAGLAINGMTLLLTEAISFWAFAVVSSEMNAQAIFTAAMMGFVAASVATQSYETVKNLKKSVTGEK